MHTACSWWVWGIFLQKVMTWASKEAIANIISILPRLLIQKDSCGMRERRLIEYLKQCFPSNISLSTNKELAYALASLPPYQVPFSDVTVVHLHCEVVICSSSCFSFLLDKMPKIKEPEAKHFADNSIKSFQLVNEVSNK